MKGGIGNLMKTAQEMQARMQRLQSEVAQTEIIGEAGAGLVKITMNGKHEVKRVELADSLMSEEKDMLEDLLTAAMNDAVRKVEAITSAKMGSATAGMNLPPGFKMPF